MIHHSTLTKTKLRQLIQRGDITLGGNRKLKIYGLLICGSGKRMKKENRVFFKNEKEALAAGFRACKNCLVSHRQMETHFNSIPSDYIRYL